MEEEARMMGFVKNAKSVRAPAGQSAQAAGHTAGLIGEPVRCDDTELMRCAI